MVGRVKSDAYEQHHDRQKKDTGKNVHDLQFTYLIDTALHLPMHKVNGGAKYEAAKCRNRPERWICAIRR